MTTITDSAITAEVTRAERRLLLGGRLQWFVSRFSARARRRHDFISAAILTPSLHRNVLVAGISLWSQDLLRQSATAEQIVQDAIAHKRQVAEQRRQIELDQKLAKKKLVARLARQQEADEVAEEKAKGELDIIEARRHAEEKLLRGSVQ